MGTKRKAGSPRARQPGHGPSPAGTGVADEPPPLGHGATVVIRFTEFLRAELLESGRAKLRERFVESFLRAPLPADLKAQALLLHPALKGELARRGIQEGQALHLLNNALELRAFLCDVLPIARRRRGGFAEADQTSVNRMKKSIRLGGRTPKVLAEAELIRLIENERLPKLRDLDAAMREITRAIYRNVNPDTFARLHGALWLTDLMRKSTGAPHVGLVAALMKSVDLVASPCWVQAPTAGTVARQRMWCRRTVASPKQRVCGTAPLRCEIATALVKEMIRSSARRVGGKTSAAQRRQENPPT